MPPNPSPSSRFNSPATLDSFRSNVTFGPGFEIRSDNDEYILQFHNLTQYEYRGYQQANQNPVQNGFLFPRQWFMFSGRLSKPFGYFVSLANGFDTVSILDCFLDVEFDPRLRFRIGHFKTPFTYEFFVEPIQGLVVPERSVFFNNFALNRSDGLMAFGRLFANQVDYAAGMFNGTRNSLINTSGGNLAALAFINWRPFAAEENTLRENFNLGGSVMAGNDFQTPVPQTFRTIVPTNGNAVAGIPFLALNNNVVNNGPHAFWDLHAAWYYRGLEVIGEWGSGFEDYGLARSSYRNRIPVESFYVQTSYLLTGETRSNIGLVKPLHPVTLKKGDFGIGAWEPYARFEYLDIGSKIFTAGLADENLWTNRLYMTHVGINWHLTQYIKIYFDWNYAEFGQPVLFAPGRHRPAAICSCSGSSSSSRRSLGGDDLDPGRLAIIAPEPVDRHRIGGAVVDSHPVTRDIRLARRDLERLQDHRCEAEVRLGRMESHRLGKEEVLRVVEQGDPAERLAADPARQVAPGRPRVVAVGPVLTFAGQEVARPAPGGVGGIVALDRRVEPVAIPSHSHAAVSILVEDQGIARDAHLPRFEIDQEHVGQVIRPDGPDLVEHRPGFAGSGQVVMPELDPELAEDRAAPGLQGGDVTDPAGLLLLVPEVEMTTLKRGIHPGEEDRVLMRVVGRKVVGDHLARWREDRVDLAIAPEVRREARRCFDHRLVIGQNRAALNGKLELLAVVRAVHRRLCG